MPVAGKVIRDVEAVVDAHRIDKSETESCGPFLASGWLVEAPEDLILVERSLSCVAYGEAVFLHFDLYGTFCMCICKGILDKVSYEYGCHLLIYLKHEPVLLLDIDLYVLMSIYFLMKRDAFPGKFIHIDL